MTEVFYNVSLNFQEWAGDIDKALRLNLELLIRALNVDRAAVFTLDEKREVLRPHQIVTRYGEMEGEGGT